MSPGRLLSDFPCSCWMSPHRRWTRETETSFSSSSPRRATEVPPLSASSTTPPPAKPSPRGPSISNNGGRTVPIECAWANARIVTPDEIFVGSVLSRDGVIASVDRGSSVPAGASDLGGDYLLPGLVELHTDNVEKHVKPRPGIVWPSIQAALIAHDRQVVSAGLTTVFDALGCGAIEENPVRQKLLTDLVNGIRQAEGAGTLRAEHLVHLRCELCDPNMRNSFDEIVMDPAVRLVSVMDHSPGQRQYKDAMSLRRAMGWNEEAHAHAQIATLMHASAEIAPPMR